jgi:predicted ATPase
MSRSMPTLSLRHIHVADRLPPEDAARFPFLKGGAVDIALQSPLTVLVGENGSGKTTLLEAVAARCGIRPAGGDSYRETEDERPGTAASRVVTLEFADRRPRGWFMRADRLHVATARPDRLRMGHQGDAWRRLDQQSRGESMLSLLSAEIERGASSLYLLDEPDTGLSPTRQLALLRLLDEIVLAGAQAIVATHSVILMAHPDADLLWVDPSGISRRRREDFEHWSVMSVLMRDPNRFTRRVLDRD